MWRIAVVFVLFLGFIITLVVYTAFLEVDLVAEDYYQQEVDYQEIIDAKENSVELKKQITIEQSKTAVSIKFPQNYKVKNIKGTVYFYHPKSAKLDFEQPFIFVDNSTLKINKSNLVKGNYTIKLKWEENDKLFYIEKSCYVS